MARFLIVGGGERASALTDALERDGHVARVASRPDRDALEHVAIVCWLSEESPERFLLGAIDSSMRGFVYQADGWAEAVLETARRNAIPVAILGADDDLEAWLAEAQGVIASLIEGSGQSASKRYAEPYSQKLIGFRPSEKGPTMTLRLGDLAPDFEADTTEGRISFHDWIGDSWAVLFSHPKDFTPVCTTELGYMAAAKPQFDSRGVKIIGLSVDPLDRHEEWAKDIEDTQGAAPNYPIISDADFNVSKLYGMLPANVDGDPLARTPADNQTVRNVFVIGPDKRVKLILVYPMTTGRNFDEVLRVVDSLQLTAEHSVSTPVNWQPGENVIIAGSVSNEQARELYPDGWEEPRPYIRIVPQPS